MSEPETVDTSAFGFLWFFEKLRSFSGHKKTWTSLKQQIQDVNRLCTVNCTVYNVRLKYQGFFLFSDYFGSVQKTWLLVWSKFIIFIRVMYPGFPSLHFR
jgi:hypothetical protein